MIASDQGGRYEQHSTILKSMGTNASAGPLHYEHQEKNIGSWSCCRKNILDIVCLGWFTRYECGNCYVILLT